MSTENHSSLMLDTGVVINHGQLAQAVYSYLFQFTLTNETTMMSFLPLAHIYEVRPSPPPIRRTANSPRSPVQRVMELVAISMGAQIGYTTGDPLNLLDDLAILRPHFMPSVPRVLNRIYQSAMAAGTQPGLKGALFRKAVATKIHNLRASGQFTHALYDRLVFRKVSSAVPGWCKVLIFARRLCSCTTYLVDGCGSSLAGPRRSPQTSWNS